MLRQPDNWVIGGSKIPHISWALFFSVQLITGVQLPSLPAKITHHQLVLCLRERILPTSILIMLVMGGTSLLTLINGGLR